MSFAECHDADGIVTVCDIAVLVEVTRFVRLDVTRLETGLSGATLTCECASVPG
jgi:hypothetical protein